MSESQTGGIGALDTKIKDITDYLKNSVLTPAEKEKESLLVQAREQAEKIVKEAEQQAAEIVANARKEAESVRHTAESALKIAAKQAVDKLKLSLEKEVLQFTAQKPVKDALHQTAIIKDFITEIIRQYADKGSFSIALSPELKQQLASFVEEEIRRQGTSGIRLSSEKITSGFAIIFDNGVLRYDFTEEALTELLTEFVRPELRRALFAK